MIEWLPIEKLEHHLGLPVQIRGIVDDIQDQGGLLFLEINDLEFKARVLVTPDKPRIYQMAKRIEKGYLVGVRGVVKECPLTTQHAVCEVQAENLSIMSTGSKMANVIKIAQKKRRIL